MSDDAIEFPNINHGLLDPATLARYFEDLKLTRVFAVILKGGAERYADAETVPLETAQQLFNQGQCHAIQIRYIWEDDEWWDTLVSLDEGAKLVRIRHDWEAAD